MPDFLIWYVAGALVFQLVAAAVSAINCARTYWRLRPDDVVAEVYAVFALALVWPLSVVWLHVWRLAVAVGRVRSE